MERQQPTPMLEYFKELFCYLNDVIKLHYYYNFTYITNREFYLFVEVTNWIFFF